MQVLNTVRSTAELKDQQKGMVSFWTGGCVHIINSEIIRPTRGAKEYRGKLSYGESIRAWNTIRFKKELINEFSKLKERQSKFNYRGVLYDNYKELIEALKKMEKNGEPIPILLSFIKVGNSQ